MSVLRQLHWMWRPYEQKAWSKGKLGARRSDEEAVIAHWDSYSHCWGRDIWYLEDCRGNRMTNDVQFNLSEAVVGLREALQSVLSDRLDVGGKHEATLVAALNSITDVEATLGEMDGQLDLLRRQAKSRRLTGFVDWAGIESILDKASLSEDAARTAVESPAPGNVKGPNSRESGSFPPFSYPTIDIPATPIRVASILDTFSESAFSYEWTNVPLTKSAWRDELDGCDLLFVESAWSGNSDEWRYCLTGPSAPRQEVIDLVEYARKRGIPSVFWNKEDPPHFADFLRTAALFDVVLTTDESCVEKYKAELGHERVGVLPFAAQPKVHNPIRPAGVFRNKEVAFGGMYFAHKFPERRQQLDYLLPAASRFKFDIFSRQLGGEANYQFPEPYDKHVVSSLPYDQMLTAYHAYRVFLNVNSVTSSSTMCARRVFEIIASGAAVVSAPSPAIASFFPDGLVPMPENQDEAFHEIRALLQPGGYGEKQILRAQRLIWAQHTFAHRVATIYDWAGLSFKNEKKTVSIIAPTHRPDYVGNILDSAGRQKDVDVELNLLTHGFSLDEKSLRREARLRGIDNLNLLSADKNSSLGSNLNRLVLASSGDIITKMDDDDYYGENYLIDLLNAKMYSGADVVGKGATYIHFESKDATILSYAASENKFSEFVRGATLTADRGIFLSSPFQDLGRSEDTTFLGHVKADGGTIYCSDRFNFWVRRSADASHHTWSVADSNLFATGPVVSYGNPTQFVTA